MMVGTTGVDRVVQRTAQLMREHDTDDIRPHAGIPLDIIQRYLNFHYSVSLDLFGSETSTNVANYFTAGLKGRWQEERRSDDHQLAGSTAQVDVIRNGRVEAIDMPALTALNQDLRAEYVRDCDHGLGRWNRILEESGVHERLFLPHPGFNRHVGAYAGYWVTPDGRLVDEETWKRHLAEWLPTDADFEHVASLMQPVYAPAKMAGWIAPPTVAINGRPIEFEYVHLT